MTCLNMNQVNLTGSKPLNLTGDESQPIYVSVR